MPRRAAACGSLNPAKVRVQIEFGQEIKWGRPVGDGAVWSWQANEKPWLLLGLLSFNWGLPVQPGHPLHRLGHPFEGGSLHLSAALLRPSSCASFLPAFPRFLRFPRPGY